MTRKEKALIVLDRLREAIPNPETELRYRNPFELVVAVLLSAQCTDKRVNITTPALFEAYPDAKSLAQASAEEIFPFIQSISFPNNKSKHLAGLAEMLVDKFDGKVPESVDDLVKLPGVGRKTAQVVASVAFDVPALPVDTHVFRVSNRIGLSSGVTTEKVEKQLKRAFPSETWGEVHHLIILHGRYHCTARSPKCDSCTLQSICNYHKGLSRLPANIEGLDRKRGKFFCSSCKRYASETGHRVDRKGLRQYSCSNCSSMSIFDTKTGKTLKQIQDYRV